MDLVLVREAGGKVMISLKHPWENWMKFPGEQEGKVSGRLFSGHPYVFALGRAFRREHSPVPTETPGASPAASRGKIFLFIITFHSIHGLLKGVCEPQRY